MNLSSKLCTIFLLESILYTSNFSLMEDSLLYVANISFIMQSLRNLINPYRVTSGSLTMAMTAFLSFCPSITMSALCSVFLSQFQSFTHQHKHTRQPSVQTHYHIYSQITLMQQPSCFMNLCKLEINFPSTYQ